MSDPGAPPALPPALSRLLAEVRAGSADHRRRSAHDPDAAATPPWSDADEDALRAFDLEGPRSVADALDRVRSELREVGAELGRLAGEAVGGAAAAACARLAASSHGRADAAESLAGELRGAGGRVDELGEGVARRVLRTLDADDRPPPWAAPSPGSDLRPPPGPAPAPDEGSPRYLALLRALRVELAAAIGSLPELLDRPERPDPADRLDRPAGGFAGPGPGPLLPGTEARRIEPGYGVRIARLPDGPPA